MSYRTQAFSATLLLCALAGSACADEGMWMPQELPGIAGSLREQGLKLDPDSLSELTGYPLNAIISLGGCTASFVSARGLIVTNHHCAYPSIQYQSTAQKNLLQEGFLAHTLHEELQTVPGYRALVAVEVSTVSDRIIDARVAKLSGRQRIDAIERNEKEMIASCERDLSHRCTIASFNGGIERHLIKQLEIRDVRLVYAPHGGVGAFGGATDNWMWPRHAGDFSFFRAYVGKDGKPADYSADNVPYVPPHHLRLAKQGPREGDFVMLAGYPRLTNRHRIAGEVEHTFNWEYPAFVRASSEQLQIIARETEGRPEAALAYAGAVARIGNYYQNRKGMLASFARSDLLERKQALLRVPQLERESARVTQILGQRDSIAKKEFLLSYATPLWLGAAQTLYETAREKSKADDAARESGYQARDWPKIRQALEVMGRHYDERVDKALVRHFLLQYLALPASEQNADFLAALGVKQEMGEPELAVSLDVLYAGSRLGDPSFRLSWLDRSPSDFRASNDSFIRAAVALGSDATRRRLRDRQLSGDLQQAYAAYMHALMAYRQARGEMVYPDANGTLRVSYGKIAGRAQGYADGTAWAPFTTLRGIVAKQTGKGDFAAPAAQLRAIEAGEFGRFGDPALGSVPVNFLATLDITGGNSGSPVLDSRGEWVGLAFDGTLDAVISDWDFDAARARVMAVDLRYLLWQMQYVDRADALLAEMSAH